MRLRFSGVEQANFRYWLPVGFLSLLALLVGLGYESYANVSRIIDHSALARHSVEVQRTIEEVQSAVNAAESDQRGFLLIGDEKLAALSDDEAINALKASALLVQLVHDNPSQSKRAKEVQTLVVKRMDRLHFVMSESRRLGIDRARRALGVFGPKLSEQIRLATSEILADENRLLAARDKQREESIRVAAVTSSISAVVTLGLLTALYSMLRRFLLEQVQARIAAEDHRRALQLEISEKERAERELQRSNRELQDFAFVASHDLQEPLRKIQAFGDRLRSKNENVLDETSLDYLSRMQNAANRMQELIDALLNLSRITTKAQPFVNVALDVVLAGVVDDLQARLEGSGGKVTVNKLPSIHADRVQMRQLFQNLIGNALKFRASGRSPHVVVSEVSSKNPDTVRIEVSDNGIGFEERHAEKIFAIFQRLHGRGEYEGSGIGLAVCRRIVDRHGGNISAESVPGEGATFIIELPKNQPEATI